MPELPDLTVYLEHIDQRLSGETLTGIRLASPFLLRTVTPTIDEVCGSAAAGSASRWFWRSRTISSWSST